MENTNKDKSALQAFDRLDLAHPVTKRDWNDLTDWAIHERSDGWKRKRREHGGNFVKYLTLEEQGDTMIALAMRHNREKVTSILETVDSKEGMELLLSTNRFQSVAQIIYNKNGAQTFIDVLLQQSSNNKSVWTEICQQTGCLSPIMKVFSEGDLEEFLTACDGDHYKVLSDVLKSYDARDALSYLQGYLGMDTVLNIILRKNNEDLPVITAMSDECMTHHLPKFIIECSDQLEERDRNGLNGLHYILISSSASTAFPLMINEYGKQESKEFLLDHNTDVITVLSLGLKQWSADCFAGMMTKFAKEEIVELLRSENGTNSTMYDIVNSENAIEFMKILIESHQLKVGDFLSALLCTEETNYYPLEAIETWLNETTSDPKSVPALVKRMKWTIDQVKNKSYPLMIQPSILVISTRVGREEKNLAVKESDSLIRAFREHLSLEVIDKYDRSEEQIFTLITDQHTKPESKSCQIVAIMSHGSRDCIHDKHKRPIPIQQLVEKMTPVTHTNYPKVLILQCCQSDRKIAGNDGFEEEVDSTNNDDYERSEMDGSAFSSTQSLHESPSPFQLNQNFVWLLLSCAAGQRSRRYELIPKFAAALQKLKPHENLYDAYVTANQALNIPYQTPLFIASPKLKICLRNVYRSSEEPVPEIILKL